MKLQYDEQTDSLYIHLSDRVAADSLEVSEGVVIDLDDDGRVVGIDIQHARDRVDLQQLSVSHLPVSQLALAA